MRSQAIRYRCDPGSPTAQRHVSCWRWSVMTDETPLPPESGAEGPGRLLREAREGKQLSLHAVADALHLRVAVVQALEGDRYDELPPATFSKGYLKAYAKLVEVPEADVLAAFERIHAPEPEFDAVQKKRKPQQAKPTPPAHLRARAVLGGGCCG
ncbi:hypothetical protein CAI21_05745 [Alkalilimnicola ehrlichii]|nr:hypothetical protein CAI21_05745 [Alkalilimnicola ehrlichii]